MVCNKCKVDKSETDFHWWNKDKGYRQTFCKECKKEVNLQTRIKMGKDGKNKKEMKYKNEKRQKYYNFLANKSCVKCGINDIRVLEFDHRDRSTKKHTVSQMLKNHSWENILIEIEKCDILCSNCHKIKTSIQLNWTRNKFITQ
jgi:hypothetical protein